MNPLMLINLPAIAAALPAKMEKDERRARLLMGAVIKKTAELVHEPEKLVAFAHDLMDVEGKYQAEVIRSANPRRWSFATLGDPFKDEREALREFGRKWDLDPEFMKEMG